ncbi:uncharacterized protein LOC143543952 [Bidens hawaiensis]|uniref:uncharacterized protein LOC143543952 n=1 Tax=Bidens hawaiensis TaxID=980011 RepID=UPI00404A5ECA
MGLSEDSCPFCELHQESANHIFTGCIFAAEIWDRIVVWCRLDPIFVFEVWDILVLAKGLKKQKLDKRVAHCIVVTALWSMWNAKNEKIFQDKEAKAYEVLPPMALQTGGFSLKLEISWRRLKAPYGWVGTVGGGLLPLGYPYGVLA